MGRLVAGLIAGLIAGLLLTGCSMGSAIPDPRLAVPSTAGPQPAPAHPASTLAIGTGTCWTGELLGADPQVALAQAAQFGITYFDAAYALQDRPSFRVRRSCQRDHAIEIYRLVDPGTLATGVAEYADLMRTRTTDFALVSAAVLHACMDRTLAEAAARSGVPDASLQPALPTGWAVDWAPPTIEQWARGQRTFACLLRQERPSPLRYAALRTRALPTQLRTCIASGSGTFVDCARRHDREVIAVLDVSGGVAAGTFPGREILRRTAAGALYVDRDASFYRPLDRACTAYLRAVSTEKRLVGVAQIDPIRWPDPDGRYRITCEADAPPGSRPQVTQGSVYTR